MHSLANYFANYCDGDVSNTLIRNGAVCSLISLQKRNNDGVMLVSSLHLENMMSWLEHLIIARCDIFYLHVKLQPLRSELNRTALNYRQHRGLAESAPAQRRHQVRK